jgi:hypothetical protein
LRCSGVDLSDATVSAGECAARRELVQYFVTKLPRDLTRGFG